jgi:L-alanine-DL-glutamate epimerase-like enolase superfamily enzyme
MDAEAYLCHFPLPEPFYPSWIPGLPQVNNSLLLVRLLTDEGIEGFAASVAFLGELKGVPELLKVFLVERDPFKVEDFVKIFRSAKAVGVRAWFMDVALWDIIGKATGQPIYRLLGGYRDRVKAYASTGELREPARRAEDARAIVEKGFRAIKIRIRSDDPRTDLAVVEAVRDAVGPDIDIMVDANQAWPIHGFGDYPTWDLKRAMAMAAELEALGVAWLEEPLGMYDYEGLSTLTSSTALTISGGEMNSDIYDFRELIERRCYDVIQPDVTLACGIQNGKKIAGMAEAAGITVNPHTWTNGVGLAANLQLMGAIPNCTYCEFPYEPPGWVPEARDAMLATPFAIDPEGYVPIPKSPGLGIEIDMDKVRAHGERVA